MRVVCAWCSEVLSDAAGPVSHGICPGCSFTVERAWHRSLLTRKAGAARKPATRPFFAPTLPLPGFPAPGTA